MQGSFHSLSGIAYPDDLKLLRQVVDRICHRHGVRDGSGDAQDVGRAAISLFAAGVFEETELVASLEEFMRRRSR